MCTCAVVAYSRHVGVMCLQGRVQGVRWVRTNSPQRQINYFEAIVVQRVLNLVRRDGKKTRKRITPQAVTTKKRSSDFSVNKRNPVSGCDH